LGEVPCKNNVFGSLQQNYSPTGQRNRQKLKQDEAKPCSLLQASLRLHDRFAPNRKSALVKFLFSSISLHRSRVFLHDGHPLAALNVAAYSPPGHSLSITLFHRPVATDYASSCLGGAFLVSINIQQDMSV